MPFSASAGLFLAVFSFFALTGPGHVSSVDGTVMLLSARNLMKTGSTSVPPDRSEHSETITPRGVDGRAYPLFGVGLTLAHVSTLFVASRFEYFRPLVDGQPVSSLDRDEFYAPFTCAWLMAAAVTGIALCGSALGFPFRSCTLLAGLMAAGSPLWHYARFDTNEPLQCASLIGATFFLLRRRSTLGGRDACFAGTLLGVALAAKALNVIVLPWFFLYAAWTAARSRVRVLFWMATPLCVIGAALAALNYSRYGSVFETGYHLTTSLFGHPLLDGASVLLFSPGFGLLVFCPAFLLLPIAGRSFLRLFPFETALIAAVFASILVVNSKFYAYWGCGWGPRFLIPAVPLLSLPLLTLIAEPGWKRRLVISALLIGFPIQAVAITASFWAQIMPVWGQLSVPVEEAILSTSPKTAAVQRVDTVLHAPSVAPLRVAFWLLENTHCRDAGQPTPPLTTPPWVAEFPWLDPERAEKLADLAGLDLWAAPTCWKAPGLVPFTPSNPRLRWLLLGSAGLGAGLLGSAWRRNDEGT